MGIVMTTVACDFYIAALLFETRNQQYWARKRITVNVMLLRMNTGQSCLLFHIYNNLFQQELLVPPHPTLSACRVVPTNPAG